MRRILRTTTAIVASLSLIAPQIAPAFAQGAPAGQEAILPKKEQQQRQQQKQRQEQKQRSEKQQQRKQAQEQKPRQQQQRPKPQQAQQQQERPKPQQAQQQRPKPQQEQARPQPQKGQQERPKPQQAQRREAPEPQQKQRQQANPEQQRPRAQQQAKPEQQRQKPQQQAKPEQQRPQPQQQARPEQNQPRPGGQQPDRRAAEPDRTPRPADSGREAARNGGTEATPNRNPQQPPRNEPARKAPPTADELRRAMDEKQRGNGDRPRPENQRAGNQRPQQSQPPRDPGRREAQRPQAPQAANANARPQPLSPEEMRRRVQSGNGKAALPAPQARKRDNEVARRAAEHNQAPKAAALTAAAAGAGGAASGRVMERKITAENARRSNEDFRNRIEDGMRARDERLDRRDRELDRRERELREDERRADRRDRDRRDDYYWDDNNDDDDDDNGKDIAKLLLAGAAGFAVGRMLNGNRQVALNTGDRAVLTLPDGSQQIVRDDNALLYQPGSDVRTESFADGSTRTTVLRSDGSRVVTIRDADTNILQRTLIRADGTQTRLLDNTYVRPVQVATLPAPQPVEYSSQPWREDDLRTALLQESSADRRFTLSQIRDIPEVRSLVAPVNVPDVTFDSGSAALTSAQAEQLATLGKVIKESIDENPNEMYMIEGYTDAVGSDAANLALSDRRAESVALALTEYFQVPPENMVVQGYGEDFLLIPSNGEQRDNRRVAVRRITDLIEQSGS